MEKFDDLVKYYKQNRLAHAYIIETNNQLKCLTDLLNSLKKMYCPKEYVENCNCCNICHAIDNYEFPSICIIKPDGKNIKKEQVLELKKKMSYKPLFFDFMVYIILQAETLNDSSTNTILKFLEEPAGNIYGFFITHSKDRLLATIQSRCQIERVFYQDSSIFSSLGISDEEKEIYINVAEEYLKKIMIEKENAIMYNKDIILDKFSEKESIEKLFKIMFEIYKEAFYISIRRQTNFSFGDFEFLKPEEPNVLLKMRQVIGKYLNNINYNLNMSLMLDCFVIEMGEIYE